MPITFDSFVLPLINGVDGGGAFLTLVEVIWPDLSVSRVAANTEDVTWPSVGGDIYTASPFDIGAIRQEIEGAPPSFAVRIGDVDKVLSAKVFGLSRLNDSKITISIIHSDNLSATNAILSNRFGIAKAIQDDIWVILTLSGKNIMDVKIPRNKIFPGHCWYSKLGGPRCGYAGLETICNRTPARCRQLNNINRIGAYISMGRQ